MEANIVLRPAPLSNILGTPLAYCTDRVPTQNRTQADRGFNSSPPPSAKTNQNSKIRVHNGRFIFKLRYNSFTIRRLPQSRSHTMYDKIKLLLPFGNLKNARDSVQPSAGGTGGGRSATSLLTTSAVPCMTTAPPTRHRNAHRISLRTARTSTSTSTRSPA